MEFARDWFYDIYNRITPKSGILQFNPSSLPDSHIYFQHYGDANFNGAWGTCFENNIFKKFIGSNAYSYESTIENVAASLIAHEWHSHYVEGTGDEKNNHSFAYYDAISSIFWQKTTQNYKNFVFYQFLLNILYESGELKR